MKSGLKNRSISVQLTTLCVLCLCVGRPLHAQEAKRTVADDLVKHWQISKDLSLAVAKAMPEAYYSFKPANADLGFADQMGNIALINVLSCTMALGTRAPERFQSAFDKPMDSTKVGIATSLTVAYDYCIDGLKQMNDADLLKMAVYCGSLGIQTRHILGGVRTRDPWAREGRRLFALKGHRTPGHRSALPVLTLLSPTAATTARSRLLERS